MNFAKRQHVFKVSRQSSRLMKALSSEFLFSDRTFTFISDSTDSSVPAHPESRILRLLLDYKEFKAARTIQRYVRGWRIRNLIAKMRHAVAVIEVAWLKYSQGRRIFRNTENELQIAIQDHFYRNAVIIQKFFRGWRIREFVHDMSAAKHAQINKASDLLTLIAFNMHHMLREREIPGVYSLRNSGCYMKVEELLATLTYRFSNPHINGERMIQEKRLKKMRVNHETCEEHTIIPFKGPNYEDNCNDDSEEEPVTKTYDRRLSRMAKVLKKVLHTDARTAEKEKLKMDSNQTTRLNAERIQIRNFCDTVIKSMKRWNIWDENKINIKSKPKNVQSFLDEASSLLKVFDCSIRCKFPDPETFKKHS